MRNFAFELGEKVMLVTSVPVAAERAAEDERIAAVERDGARIEYARLSVGMIENGEVIARAEYQNGAPPSYLIRYRDGTGCQVEAWFTEDAIVGDSTAAFAEVTE